MLLEKHRPKKIEHIIGNRKQVGEVLSWLSSWKPGFPNLILFGPQGSGKNLTVSLVAETLKMQEVKYDPDEDLQDFLSSLSQSSMFYRKKLVVVDDVESVNAKTVKSIVEASKWPVIFTSTDPYNRKLLELRKGSKLVRFYRPNSISIFNFLRKICVEDKIKFEEDAIKQLSVICNGDIRSALLDLEILGKEVTMKKLQTLGFRNQEDSIFETLKIIFKTRDIQNSRLAVEKSEKTPEEIFNWILSNVSEEYEKPDDVAKSYNYLSKADIFRSRVMKRQSWSLMKYFESLSTLGITVSKKEAYRKFFIYKAPKYQRSELKEIQEKISSRLGISTRQSLAYMELVKIMVAKDKKAAGFFDFDKDEVKLLKSY